VKRGPLGAFRIANSITYLSLVCGVGAIAAAAGGRASAAGALIAASVLADTFDGSFARRFARSSEERQFGMQLDSLSDAIAFGAAPAVCMTLLAQQGATPIQVGRWIAVAVFTACAITRLAFYNVTHEETDGFVGLPAPVAALVWSTVLLTHPGAFTSVLVLAATAAAMVLPLRIPRPRGMALAIFVLWPVGIVLAHLRLL
jgi:CDP-diacylglycerol--serine O-phosphatidyltransferase